MNQQSLISQIEEVGADVGQPDCKLTEPFIVGPDNTLSPWLVDITSENVFMLSSDKILKICFDEIPCTLPSVPLFYFYSVYSHT